MESQEEWARNSPLRREQHDRELDSAQSASVYRQWDKDGRLLYVGMANDPLQRNLSHMRGVRHKYEIASITFEWFATREEASAAESKAISEENPAYNKRKRDEVEVTIRLLKSELAELDRQRRSSNRSKWIRRLINESK